MGRKGKIIGGLLIIGLCIAINAPGQIINAKTLGPDGLEAQLTGGFGLLPLTQLMDSTLRNSPLLALTQLDLKSNNATLSDNRMAILKALTFNGAYAYGTNASFSSSESSRTDLNNTLNISESAIYSVGVGVKISLYDILNRKNLIKQVQLDRQKILKNQAMVKMGVQEQLIVFYNDCLLKKKLLDLFISNQESAFINLQLAQKQFQAAEITIADITTVIDSHAKIVADIEAAKVDLQVSLFKLSQLSGVAINDLIISTE